MTSVECCTAVHRRLTELWGLRYVRCVARRSSGVAAVPPSPRVKNRSAPDRLLPLVLSRFHVCSSPPPRRRGHRSFNPKKDSPAMPIDSSITGDSPIEAGRRAHHCTDSGPDTIPNRFAQLRQTRACALQSIMATTQRRPKATAHHRCIVGMTACQR